MALHKSCCSFLSVSYMCFLWLDTCSWTGFETSPILQPDNLCVAPKLQNVQGPGKHGRSEFRAGFTRTCPSFMSKDARFRSSGLFSHCCKITGITNVLSLKQKQFGGELSFQNDALIIWSFLWSQFQPAERDSFSDKCSEWFSSQDVLRCLTLSAQNDQHSLEILCHLIWIILPTSLYLYINQTQY